MTMFDEAAAIKTMLDMRKATRTELSKSLGISPSAIANKLRLLKLPEEARAAVTKGGLSERHARLLLRLHDKESQLELIKEIEDRRLTVAEAEALCELKYLKILPEKPPAVYPTEAKDAFITSITESAKSLTALGISTRSKISYRDKKVYISIIMEDS